MNIKGKVEIKFSAKSIDQKWQRIWEERGLNKIENDASKPNWYELTMYPYPSGDLHIGHWYAMAPADAHARFRRMQGYNVLHPMGFDAFGLPAENAAISRGIHPKNWTMDNIKRMRAQLKSMGAIYDWDREVVCCLPEYYKWNQWMFLQMFKNDLAYRSKAPVVWCPSCQTVLANEQVLNGVCERCQTPVTHRDLAQWFLKITQYAEELLNFDGLVDWPDRIITMQRNWIGKSHGVNISFDLSHLGLEEKEIKTFTTRIDTIFGVTFMVLAPEHPLVLKLTTPEQRPTVETYLEQSRIQTEIERMSTNKEKTGVPLGTYVVNRVNGRKIPLYTADYVLTTYGTGAVMGVPAHDQRDYDFAVKFDLPIIPVISPENSEDFETNIAYAGDGILINSG
ncbi:MAG: class I tRNA ligase family protein, partial [Chloroflexota bacterium]|nr:class I tRNA ligase family protein [Chloroflexota bacterium]